MTDGDTAPGPAATARATAPPPAGAHPGGHGADAGPVPAAGGGRALAALADCCRAAESAGASALWAVDHLFWPRPMLECLTSLTVAATATTGCHVGSCVVQVPLRSPAALAKAAQTLQWLSGGRFVLGVGSGSHPGEYAAAGVDYAARGALLDDGLARLRRCWDSADIPVAGGYRQQPAGAPIPVWVGGSSVRARRRAAAAGDGWIPLFVDPDRYRRGVAALRHETEAAGRDPASVAAAVVLPVHVGPRPSAAERGCAWLSALYGIPAKAFGRHLVAGPAGACADAVARYLDAGASHVALMVADDDPLSHFGALVAALGERGTAPAPGAVPAAAPEPVGVGA